MGGEASAFRPSRTDDGRWELKTVPVLADNGDIIAIRPVDRHQANWEQDTVPILGKNGEIVAIRASGDRYEMPAWRRSGRPNTSGTLSSNASEKTLLSPRSPRSLASGFESVGAFGTSMLPIPSD